MLAENPDIHPGTVLGGNIVQPPSDLPKLSDLGIGHIQSHRWQLEKSVPGKVFEKFAVETKAKNEELECGYTMLQHYHQRKGG